MKAQPFFRSLAAVVVAVGLLAVAGCGIFLNDYNVKEESAENGITRLSGTITDAAGNPLSDVHATLRVVLYRYDDSGILPYHTNAQEATITNGTFDWTFPEKAADVRVFLKKDGYQDKDFYVFTVRLRTDQKDTSDGFAVNPAVGVRTDIKVAMIGEVPEPPVETAPASSAPAAANP